jgi:chloride channel protein, CIC family
MSGQDRPGSSERGVQPALDPGEMLRSKQFRRLLVLSAAIGVVVSLAAWCFLELIHYLQQGAFEDLPRALGFDTAPSWWPLPVLGLAGLIIAFAIVRLPGGGGHVPAEGLKTGPPTTPIELPGVLLAALASIGLGLVLGPEAPLIGLGTGTALLVVQLSKRDVPDQGKVVIAAAASFAALATIFGSPIIGAVLIIEAAGLGGPTMPLVLLPGLIAAGIGSLVFIGIGTLTGLSSAAYAIAPLSLPAYPTPTVVDFLWTIALAIVAALLTFVIVRGGRWTNRIVMRRPFVLIPIAALAIAALAMAFGRLTDLPSNAVLFSGQEEMGSVMDQAGSLAVGTLVLLFLFKGLAWSISLGAARGGPTFPAIFLGVVGGLVASHLPGLSDTPALAVLIGAFVVSVLRLPLSSIVIALLVSQAGVGVSPLIIVGVAVAYVCIEIIEQRTSRTDDGQAFSGFTDRSTSR